MNIGTEENKGTQLQLDVLPLLKEAPIHFTGNVEACGLPLGEVDVAVTDGFTGNIILKTSEGMGKFFSNELKSMVKSFPGMLGAPFLAGKLRALKKKSDSNEAGGAPLLGLRKPVIKAHGSSNAKAFKNAIRQAMTCQQNNMVGLIEEYMEHYRAAEAAAKAEAAAGEEQAQ